MMYIAAEDFGVNLVRMTHDGDFKSPGDLHARRNYELCRAIDITSLHIILDTMVASKHISQRQADIFLSQAQGLLAIILSENHRSFLGSKEQAKGIEVRRYGVDVE